MIALYNNLITEIRRINNSAQILLSGILPRIFDHDENGQYVTLLIRAISQFCKTKNYTLAPSYKPLNKSGSPKENCFAQDGLHLTTPGSILLRDYIHCLVAEKLEN